MLLAKTLKYQILVTDVVFIRTTALRWDGRRDVFCSYLYANQFDFRLDWLTVNCYSGLQNFSIGDCCLPCCVDVLETTLEYPPPGQTWENVKPYLQEHLHSLRSRRVILIRTDLAHQKPLTETRMNCRETTYPYEQRQSQYNRELSNDDDVDGNENVILKYNFSFL